MYRVISDKHKDFFQIYGNKLSNLLNQNGPGINYDNPTWGHEGFSKNHWMLSGKLVSRLKRNNTLRLVAKKVYRTLNK